MQELFCKNIKGIFDAVRKISNFPTIPTECEYPSSKLYVGSGLTQKGSPLPSLYASQWTTAPRIRCQVSQERDVAKIIMDALNVRRQVSQERDLNSGESAYCAQSNHGKKARGILENHVSIQTSSM